MKVAGAVCDLCHHLKPSLYCSSDSAYLCLDCDSQVHTANFLVARHIRVSIDHENDDVSSSSSSSSSNVRMSAGCRRKTTSGGDWDWKTRDVLVSWCSSWLGGSNCSSSVVIEVARHAFQVWWVKRNINRRPYRVGLAASLWLGLLIIAKTTKGNLVGGHDKKKRSQLLKRLEEISGVPAKSILLQVVEQSKLIVKHRYHHPRPELHQEESWAEC